MEEAEGLMTNSGRASAGVTESQPREAVEALWAGEPWRRLRG